MAQTPEKAKDFGLSPNPPSLDRPDSVFSLATQF